MQSLLPLHIRIAVFKSTEASAIKKPQHSTGLCGPDRLLQHAVRATEVPGWWCPEEAEDSGFCPSLTWFLGSLSTLSSWQHFLSLYTNLEMHLKCIWWVRSCVIYQLMLVHTVSSPQIKVNENNFRISFPLFTASNHQQPTEESTTGHSATFHISHLQYWRSLTPYPRMVLQLFSINRKCKRQTQTFTC